MKKISVYEDSEYESEYDDTDSRLFAMAEDDKETEDDWEDDDDSAGSGFLCDEDEEPSYFDEDEDDFGARWKSKGRRRGKRNRSAYWDDDSW